MRNKNKNPAQKEYTALALAAVAPQLGIVLIVVIALFKSWFTTEPNPLDNDINKRRRLVDEIYVVDSTHNGFKVTYATRDAVSDARSREINSRAHIDAGFERLKKEAPIHFGGLLMTDIYDFAAFAKMYDSDEDVRLNRIFVFGKEKCDMYIGPNPRFENPARWISPITDQGIQYITEEDIYYRGRGVQKVYRYWKCTGMDATSSVDERFSHFSEEERVQ